MPVILATWEAEIRKIVVGSQTRQIVLKKNPTQNWAGGVVQPRECLPSKHEVLSSNPNIVTHKRNISSYLMIEELFSTSLGAHTDKDSFEPFNLQYSKEQKIQAFFGDFSSA
jgi:hypothetical protein